MPCRRRRPAAPAPPPVALPRCHNQGGTAVGRRLVDAGATGQQRLHRRVAKVCCLNQRCPATFEARIRSRIHMSAPAASSACA
jgi:hypothetical protein